MAKKMSIKLLQSVLKMHSDEWEDTESDKQQWPKDKTGRTIRPGDTLKVFHFVGARGKRHYMYKYAVGYTGEKGQERLVISHLNGDSEDTYTVSTRQDTVLIDYEILQGHYGGISFEDRPCSA